MILEDKLRIEMFREYQDLKEVLEDLIMIIMYPCANISEEDILEHTEKTNLLVNRLSEINNILKNLS